MTQTLYCPFSIGELHLKGNILAAPMAGYTDVVTRYLALKGGANLTYTEMISSEALIRDSQRTILMMERATEEEVLAVQLFGADPEVLGKAALIARDNGADLLDLNAGCPVNKVVSKGAGTALGRDSGRLKEALAAMRDSGLPVTVKIRSGWDEGELTWRQTSAAAVEGGAQAIGFHPRTRKQAYGGKADWSLITALASDLNIPVIGSGDLRTHEDAGRMLKECGCAAVMFGRGAIGNPNIYKETRAFLLTGKPTVTERPVSRLETSLEHLKMAALKFGENTAAREMKKHLAGYIRGWESAAGMRREIMKAPDYGALHTLINNYISELASGIAETE